jgi:hypothetical protein
MPSSLKRIAAVGCAALLLSLVAVGVAAGFKTGKYAGTTSQGEAISFKAKEKVVKKFDFRAIIECDDGTRPGFNGFGARAPINDKAKFKAHFTGEGLTSVVKGKLKRKKGEGTIETTGTIPSGANCSSVADWNAEKQ